MAKIYNQKDICTQQPTSFKDVNRNNPSFKDANKNNSSFDSSNSFNRHEVEPDLFDCTRYKIVFILCFMSSVIILLTVPSLPKELVALTLYLFTFASLSLLLLTIITIIFPCNSQFGVLVYMVLLFPVIVLKLLAGLILVVYGFYQFNYSLFDGLKQSDALFMGSMFLVSSLLYGSNFPGILRVYKGESPFQVGFLRLCTPKDRGSTTLAGLLCCGFCTELCFMEEAGCTEISSYCSI